MRNCITAAFPGSYLGQLYVFYRLYTLDGKLVENGLELENGQFYVAVGREKFKKLPYNEVMFTKSAARRSYG